MAPNPFITTINIPPGVPGAAGGDTKSVIYHHRPPYDTDAAAAVESASVLGFVAGDEDDDDDDDDDDAADDDEEVASSCSFQCMRRGTRIMKRSVCQPAARRLPRNGSKRRSASACAAYSSPTCRRS